MSRTGRSTARSRTSSARGGAGGMTDAAKAYHARMAQRDRQMKTNYSLGDDKTTWETEYTLIKPSRVVAAVAPVKVNRNASDKRDIFGDVPIDPADHFKGAAARDFGPDRSVMSKQFEKARPLPGFDRKTANRTNYELGVGTKVEYTTANKEATTDPSRRPLGVQPRYKARRDRELDYDLITGKSRDPASTFVPSGFAKTSDVAVINRTRSTTYNIISGRNEPTVRPPPKRTSEAVTVKAPLGSLACLRPPTGQGIL
mmetsp:Transcript_11357/g.39597  ORF Transcript_11357/g.39597 Transcript_11357/m.39597 type:complete len:257 (-) Transcript_11357:7-777(-)